MRLGSVQKTLASLSLLLLVSAGLSSAQGVLPGRIIGKVVLPNGSNLNGSARVTLQTFRGVKSSVFTDNEGQFQFDPIVPGSYQVVVDANFFEVTTVNVEVFPNQPSLVTIVLKERASNDTRDARRTISATELDPNIPSKAKREFDQATKASKEGKAQEAIAHLQKAIEIYPQYLMAYNDLGVQFLALGKLEEADSALRQAVALDPKAFNPSLNLGIVLVHQHRFSEAAEILRKASSVDGSAPSVRLYLGMALVGLDDLSAAEKELKTAHELGGADYALALFHLGQIYMNRGQREQACKVFEAYLREAPNASNSAQVRELLAKLR